MEIDTVQILADISAGSKTAIVIRGIVVFGILIACFGGVRKLWRKIRRKSDGGEDNG